jgi:clorobiocin biosynthesis protein CloN6
MDFDVILLHAPSVYDFRNRSDIVFAYLSNSDSVHVSPIFEMPPVGMLSIKQHLEGWGLNVEFFNIASKMLRCPEFDVEDFLKRTRAKYVGIDLHWLAHAQGALEIAKLYRKLHPEAFIFFGGISSTYFHEELINYDQVDFVIRGVDTLLPVEMLVKAGYHKEKLMNIPNLTWKHEGEIHINRMSYMPGVYSAAVDWKKIFAAEKRNIKPYNIVIPQVGCEYNCHWCGGSSYFFKDLMCPGSLAQKTPEMLEKELKSIADAATSSHTVTMINYWHEYDSLLNAAGNILREKVISQVHISLRRLPAPERIRSTGWSQKMIIELSPDSHDPEIARACGHAYYSMAEMERFIDSLLDDVYSFEVYFLIGLPKQTKESVWDTVNYCEHLLEKYRGRKVIPFICPMLPFLDPGSVFYENADEFGYRIIHKTLEEHRRALTSMNWRERLNFETRWMSRSELVDITYESIKELTLLKNKYGILPLGITQGITGLIDSTKDLLEKVDIYIQMPGGDEKNSLGDILKKRILEYNEKQFAAVRSQQRPVDFGFAEQQWFDTD